MGASMKRSFPEWSTNWKRLKDKTGKPADIEAVLEQWRIPPPPQTLGRPFPKVVGSRKNYVKPRGEQKIELQLLGKPGTKPRLHKISAPSAEKLVLYPVFNNFAAAKLSGSTKGQVIADVMGVLHVGIEYHPLSIEVKVTNGNCWTAVVQNLQQVRFFRSWGKRFRQGLKEYCDDVPRDAVAGSWGMVLAPPTYWEKARYFSEASALLKILHKKTTARILLASINEVGEIKLVGGHKGPM